MAKISDLPAVGVVDGTEQVVLVQAGATVRASLAKVTEAATIEAGKKVDQARAARDEVLGIGSQVRVWPSIQHGGVAFIDSAGNIGPTLLFENSPMVAAIMAELARLARSIDATGAAGGTTVWPAITNGSVAFVDGAGRTAAQFLTATSTVFADVLARLRAVEAGGGPGGAGLVSEVWPAIEPGTSYIDAAGRVPPSPLTAGSRIVKDLQDAVAALRASATDTPAFLKLVGEVAHGILYGQSMTQGTGSGPLLSSTTIAGGLMFAAGVRVQDGASQPATSFALLREQQSPTIAAQQETIASGLVQRIGERLLVDYGCTLPDINHAVLMTACGEGGASVSELQAGTVPFDRLMGVLDRGATISAATGKSYNPLFLAWLQGESDQNATAATYTAAVTAIRDAARAKADLVRGYARPMLFVTYQPTSWATAGNHDPLNAASFLDLAEERHGLFSAVTYHLPHSDSYHLFAAGYKQLGAHFGDVLYDYLFGEYKRPALRPRVERLSPRELLLHYDVRPGARLVFDDSAAVAAGETIANRGFRIVPATDTRYVNAITDPRPPVEIAIDAVRCNLDTVYIRTLADIPAGTHELRQGWYDCFNRNVTHLRDNAGDVLPVFDPAGLNLKLHNWAPVDRARIA